MDNPEAARRTTFIKYLTGFQKETDINLFVLDYEDFGKKLTEEKPDDMLKTPAYRLTGMVVEIIYLNRLTNDFVISFYFLGIVCQHCRRGNSSSVFY